MNTKENTIDLLKQSNSLFRILRENINMPEEFKTLISKQIKFNSNVKGVF